MNKEEILRKSRTENKNLDIFELEIINKGSSIAMRVGLIVCCLISAISAVFIAKDNCWMIVSMPCWTIYFSMLGSLYVFKYSKLRKTHELLFAIIYLLVCVFMFTRFILYIAGIWC